jgi:formylglycine-generating enzyme
MSRKGAATALALVASIGAACAYNTRFEDCTIRCDSNGAACPDGLSCGAESFCRAPGTIGTCSTILGDAGVDALADALVQQPLSCEGLAATCGPSGNDSCCDMAMPIPGGTYYRSYDVASDAMFPDMSYPATVSSFMLDKYEVTVGRFRKFVEAGMGTQANPPAAGAGAHTVIPDSGWDPSWDGDLATDAIALGSAIQCDATYATWTAAPGPRENLPINCVTWYEAVAFCAWDGGYLPTEAEWNYAAAGGAEQRAYPWSSPPGNLAIDCSYANEAVTCVPPGVLTQVGSTSPKGDGLWGHTDLAGNAWEWVLDWSAPYADPCVDCADLTAADLRIVRGGSLNDAVTSLRTAYRLNGGPSSGRFGLVGFRCAQDF